MFFHQENIVPNFCKGSRGQETKEFIAEPVSIILIVSIVCPNIKDFLYGRCAFQG